MGTFLSECKVAVRIYRRRSCSRCSVSYAGCNRQGQRFRWTAALHADRRLAEYWRNAAGIHRLQRRSRTQQPDADGNWTDRFGGNASSQVRKSVISTALALTLATLYTQEPRC